MNLLELITQYKFLIFNHPRMSTECVTSLFFFEKSMKDYEKGILAYLPDSKYLDKVFDTDMSGCLLLDDDVITEIANDVGLLIFPNIDKYEKYKLTHTNFDQDIISCDMRIVVLNNMVDRTIDSGVNVYVKLTYTDTLMPVFYSDGNVDDKVKQIMLLYDDMINTLSDNVNPLADVIHFTTIPDVNKLANIRSLIISSHTKMVFYVNDDNASRYNDLLSSLEAEENSTLMKQDIVMSYKRDGILFRN